MVDRHRPAKDMVRLIQLLCGHKASGLSVDEISARMETSPRTVHRYLAALKDIEPDLTYFTAADSQRKLWYLPSARTRVPAITAEQLANLKAIASFMRAQGHQEYAKVLQDLRDGLQAGLDRATLVRLDPDLEVLDANVEAAHRPGPRAPLDPAVRSQLLKAIAAERQIEFLYTNVRGLRASRRRVLPYALVVGPRAYLVGRDEVSGGIRNYALTGIRDVEEREEAAPRSGFDAAEYVARSFGAFHDGHFHDWTLRFRGTAAHALEGYQFHPSQKKALLPSGEVEISFHCESIREVAHECFRWSEDLISIGPAPLRDMVTGICEDMKAACERQAVR